MNRRAWRWVVSAWLVSSAIGAPLACGSSNTSTGPTSFGDGGTDATHGSGSMGDARGPDSSKLSGDSGTTHPTSDGHIAPVEGGFDGACAAHKTSASIIPAYLVFVMDRSDSMKQYGKWPACSAALESFFSDPSTAGIYSSLTFMPYVKPDAADTAADPGYSCTATDYTTPEVVMTALPSSAFAPVITAEPLKLGTPTTPALNGALTYAETIKAAHPDAKVLIVLATDGYPAGCTNNTVPDVAKAASVAATTDGIPVYVIGVGPDTSSNTGISSLNEVAEAGATGSAFFIPTEVDGGDAGVTQQAFLAAVHEIQGTLGCEYAIPAPPSGEQLDFDKVNVVLSANGTDTTLVYSADCSNASGWYYVNDDAGTPEKIDLCAASCANVHATSTTSSISVILGCDTSGGGPK